MFNEFTKQLLPALRMLLVLTVLTGILYPVAITLAAGVIFPYQANGSLEKQNDQVIGSALIGQSFASDRYFWPRPSAVSYNPLPSGATNLGPTSAALKQQMDERAAAIRAANKLPDDAVIPTDLLFASASGLDPHISPDAARLQINRIAAARGFTPDQTAKLTSLVDDFTESPQLGFLGQPRVNVLLLNIALDGLE
ncbi:MAG: potassium-transporting ATPase subunit KdpC [Anaerolineae bacterium]|nr:potassium-transporting ATPase subunit KdpC [Anaerolineae bacterium]